MKRAIQQLLLLGVTIMLFSNCKKGFLGNSDCANINGPIISQTIDLSTIHSMDIKIPVELILQESASQEIIMETSQGLIDAILDDSFVQNEKWNVQLEDCSINNSINLFPVKITASLAALKEIKLTGLENARSNGVFKNIESLKLEIEGSGEFDFNLGEMQSLETKVSGTGVIDLAGFAIHHFIDMSGSGKVKAFDLTSTTCDIKISGLGECEVTVVRSLNVDMSGIGKVCYKGTPWVKIRGRGQVNDCN
ncbi:MAG: DUF2807 domain-containing protein [Bacteroidota bacterium]